MARARPPAPRGAALRDTEWRLIEIDGEKVSFDDWRRRPQLRLDDEVVSQGRPAAIASAVPMNSIPTDCASFPAR